MPERVVLFHDFSEALGGASHLVQVLIRELRNRNIPLTFIAGDTGTNFHRDDLEFLSLGGQEIAKRSKLGALTTGLYNPKVYQAVKKWIADNDTPRTIYHLHGWSKILTTAVFAALKPVSGRLVLHGHDYFNCCPNGGFFNFKTETDCSLVPLGRACLTTQCDKSSYAQKLWRSGREGLRRGLNGGGWEADRLLMIHPGQTGNFLLGGWSQTKLVSVRNPVSPPLAERVRAEKNSGIVFIGRISAEKGADLAARAALQAGIPITYVGDGSEVDRIRKLNPTAVFLGRQDRSGVARALAVARLAVMSSRWSEPFGLVALEAIGSGVPAVVSDRALVAQEIEEAGFGVSVDVLDVNRFASVLMDLHADDDRIESMSRAGHTRYLELCNSESGWADEIVNQYRAMIAQSDEI